jgi:glycosyltransferase involved in cell wall biosynthesis
VLETLRLLRDRGIDASLTVVGTTPPQTDLPVETIGFLNQQVAEDLERYRSLWREATFLFMPSRAETFGAVYAEAAANGVPSIALDIGGVGDAVVDGENGRLLPRESDAETCARTISEMLDAPDTYELLVRSSRDRYETTLNWNVWCTSTLAILEGILGDRKKEKIR